MFEQFHEWYAGRHEYAKQWKEKTGGKVVGYFCSYAPIELMYAANILPVRILGGHEPPELTEPYIFGMYCPFCRDVLEQGLRGRYDYLDGIMIAQSCLHLRQSFNSWKLHIPVDFAYYLYHPMKVQSKHARPYLRQELENFKQALEEWSGKEITDEALGEATELVNKNRRLMRQIYDLRRDPDPHMTGLEAMEMVASSQMVDVRDHNKALEGVLAKLPERKAGKEEAVRLMIVGSENDDTALVGMIESLDAVVVIDDHCTGSRFFWNEVVPNGDRMLAIAERYCDRPPCPSKDWEERRRFPHILNLAKDWGVQGAIIVQQKFCDPHELDIPPLRQMLEDNGIPTYPLELDVTVPLGQFKIRVEAFLEMLRSEELF